MGLLKFQQIELRDENLRNAQREVGSSNKRQVSCRRLRLRERRLEQRSAEDPFTVLWLCGINEDVYPWREMGSALHYRP